MTNSTVEKTFQEEIDAGERFAFGENWSHFLQFINEETIAEAVLSLKRMLEVEDLHDKSFLDIGSGSGLFSLAARRLGARVFSFDFDKNSVACTEELKKRYFSLDEDWKIEAGSVLDKNYLDGLGKFDIVYSWGVLHSTGDMWAALENVVQNVSDDGKLFIALYNYQPFASKYWLLVKQMYNKYRFARPILLAMHWIYPTLPSMILRFVQGRKYPRGMNVWRDLLDWVGGYPFEVSKPEEIFEYYKARGFRLTKLKTVGGKLGCNEFVFHRSSNTIRSAT